MHVARSIQKVVGKTRAKHAILVAKKVKKVNTVYDNVSTPVYFMEVTNEHFPQYIPFKQIITLALTASPNIQALYEIYDSMSTSKDVCEGIAFVAIKGSRISSEVCVKTRIVFAIKVYLLIYRLAWIILTGFGVHKSCVSFTQLIDYINMFMNSIL